MIRRIKIADFKSIRQLDLSLDPVTVLVGRSGSGKSNIVQAIRFIRNFLLNGPQAIHYEGGWQRLVPANQKEPKTYVELTFDIPGEEGEYTYAIAFLPAPHRQELIINSERLELSKRPIYARRRSDKGWVWDTPPKMLPNPPQHAETPMLGSFPSLQKVTLAFAALTTGLGYYHFPSSTLNPAQDQNPHHAFLQGIPGLSDTASNYRDIMRSITQDFHHPNLRKSLLATIRAVNPSIVSIELDSLTNPQRAVVAHSAGTTVFDLSLEQESDGVRRFYAHLLALYQSPPKLTMIFEEPENAIFPGALSLLADEFKASPRENRGQVILTTHNPTFLDSFDVDSVRVVEMRDHTVAGLVSKEQRQAVKDHLLTTGDLLTLTQPKVDLGPIAEQAA
jgi:predicted ATPase